MIYHDNVIWYFPNESADNRFPNGTHKYYNLVYMGYRIFSKKYIIWAFPNDVTMIYPILKQHVKSSWVTARNGRKENDPAHVHIFSKSLPLPCDSASSVILTHPFDDVG